MLTLFMIFRDTLRSILVFVNENYCLCTCFTELYLFHWLLVVPLAIFIAAPGCFQSNINIACRNTENAARKYHSLLKITDNKTINTFINGNKIKVTNSLSCWSVNGNSINRTANLVPVKSENPSGWPKRWFGEFFLSFSLKAHNYYPAYHIGPDFSNWKVPALWNSLHENVL